MADMGYSRSSWFDESSIPCRVTAPRRGYATTGPKNHNPPREPSGFSLTALLNRLPIQYSWNKNRK